MDVRSNKIQQARVDVTGMHCAACSSRIEKVVRSMEGVLAANVNLALQEMDLRWENSLVSYQEIQDRVAALGFGLGELLTAEGQVVDVSISGMSCAACSSRIEKVIGKMPGVLAAEVNLAAQSGRFQIDPEICTVRRVKETIEKLGFSVAQTSSGIDDNLRKKDEARAELGQMKKRLVAMVSLALPLLYVSMGHMVGLPLPSFLQPETCPVCFGSVQLILVLPIVWLGRNFYLNGIPALLRRAPNMDSLIAMGTGAALVYSLWNFVEILLGISPAAKAMDLYFESAGILLAMVSIGKYLENRAKLHTSDAITQLMELRPDFATLIVDGEQKTIHAAEIEKGDLLLIRPGERIPADGIIEKGESSIDESMLTGESIPVGKCAGDKAMAGTMNGEGALELRCTKVGEESLLSGIIRLVQEAQGTKAPIATVADRISLYFVPVVMILAVITGLSWLFFGGIAFSEALRFFIAVLVIACPCAMGLATPTSLMVGMGRGAQLGILVKNGAALEMAEKVDTVVFDKTGTLTRGKPELTDVEIIAGNGERKELLRLAASCELSSQHPLAAAMVEAAEKEGLALIRPERFKNVGGQGVVAQVDSRHIVFGNREFLEVSDVDFSQYSAKAEQLALAGKTVLYLGVDEQPAAMFALADTLKEESRAAVAALKKSNRRVVMLTGDNMVTARAIAKEAGVDEIIAEVFPDQKAARVADLQEKGCCVAMVGDGINDAPALAKADVGIAMGTGVDIAVESGDIVLMKGDLNGVYTGLRLSHAVMRNIRQNLAWAFIFNVIGIPVAAGVLTLFGGPGLNPMLAGAAMAMSSVTVVTNALRLRFFTAEEV